MVLVSIVFLLAIVWLNSRSSSSISGISSFSYDSEAESISRCTSGFGGEATCQIFSLYADLNVSSATAFVSFWAAAAFFLAASALILVTSGSSLSSQLSSVSLIRDEDLASSTASPFASLSFFKKQSYASYFFFAGSAGGEAFFVSGDGFLAASEASL